MTLTEQWKKGELPSTDENHTWLAYYLKQASGRIHADSYWRGNWGHADRNSIIEVLAPVPSYEEREKLAEENQQLKELLKRVNELFEWIDRDEPFYIHYELWKDIKKVIGDK